MLNVLLLLVSAVYSATPKDCSALNRNGTVISGYYTVYPEASNVVVRANEEVAIPATGVRVYCSFEKNEAWMLMGTFKDGTPDGPWAHGPYTYDTAPAPDDSSSGTTRRFPFKMWNDVMMGLGPNGAIRITSTVYEAQDPQYTYCRGFWKKCRIKDDSENYDNSCQESFQTYSNGTFGTQEFESDGRRKDGHGSITGFLGKHLLSGHGLTLTGFQGGHPALGRCRKSDLVYKDYEHNRGFMFWMGETVVGGTTRDSLYPAVKIVDIDSTDIELAALKTKCPTGYSLVSIQNAAHVIWLYEKVEQLKGRTYLTQGKGIPLGYDYNDNAKYSDLNDETRSVHEIFDKLRTDQSWTGDYNIDQTSQKQRYAGFGWGVHRIENWAPTGHRHTTKAIICEKPSDPCLSNNGGCDAKADCTNNAGVAECSCRSGYTGNGKTCTLIPDCTPNGITAIGTQCKCSTVFCDAGKWCYDSTCATTAKYPACPSSFQTALTTECVCETDTTTCAVGQWCYEGSCKSSAKCNVRSENHKNLFYGAKVYGKWNATAKRMYMNFTTPWDISVSKIKWKYTTDTTMQYLSAAKGLWTVDQATDPCKHTYNLDVPQTTFFGAGSNFTITGSQLRTNLRVEASENIQVVKNSQSYSYTRSIKNTVPVLVNLVTKTTIAVRFRSTAAPPGPGPAPALEDFVLFVGAEDYFATDDPHVLITMKVHSRTCVDHSLPDTGVRVKTGADNIKTGSTQTFTWTKDSNGDIIAPYEHNLCVEELSWKFYPKKYKENTYEIELEFDLKNLPQKFTTIAAIDIKQADVLADIGFTSSIDVYNNSNCTAESKNNKVILGHKFYTKIVLTDMIIDAKNITCNTYKIKQTKGGSTFETDMKGELKYAFEEKHIISPTVKNSHICGAELESHHFHVSVDGFDTVLETEIEIHYDQTNSRRKLITIPISHNMWDDEIWETEVGMGDDGFEEVGIGATEYDETDKEFRETKRAPDQDDMVVNLFVETESAKGTAVGDFMDTDSTKLFLTMSLCVLIVGVLGFMFGYTQTKSSGSYREIPDNYNTLLVEMN